jgi:ABC-2 type transport system permease protein
MIMLHAISALAIKEFLALLRDKRSRLVLIGPPILQLLVFGYAATFDLNNVPVAIYNQDTGIASREFISRLEGSPHFEVIQSINRNADISSLIDNKKVLMVLHIDSRFSANLHKKTPAPVQVILDGRNSNTEFPEFSKRGCKS